MAGLSILHQIKVDDALGFLTDWECVSINFLIQVLLFLIGFGIYQLCN